LSGHAFAERRSAKKRALKISMRAVAFMQRALKTSRSTREKTKRKIHSMGIKRKNKQIKVFGAWGIFTKIPQKKMFADYKMKLQ